MVIRNSLQISIDAAKIRRYGPVAMKLENATAIPAQVTVAELPGEDNRIGVLTAKATLIRSQKPRFSK
jgi:hypothetical protein